MNAPPRQRTDAAPPRAGSRPPAGQPPRLPLAGFAAAIAAATADDAYAKLAEALSNSCGWRVLLIRQQTRGGPLRLAADSASQLRPGRLDDGGPLEQAASEAILLAAATAGGRASQTDSLRSPLADKLASELRADAIHCEPLASRDPQACGGEDLSETVLVGISSVPAPRLTQAERDAVAKTAAAIDRLHESLALALRRKLRDACGSRRKRCLAAAGMLGLALAFCPAPFWPAFECTCEPTVQRVVVAPFDAVLLTAAARPGDHVSRGDVLAELDGEDLRAELASITASRRQAEQRRRAALRDRNAVEAESERLQAEQFAAEQALLERRIEQLVIRSPLDGVVLAGDLDIACGAALTRGQTLMEVAEPDALVARVPVDESLVSLVERGAEACGVFSGWLGERWRAPVLRVAPMAEQLEGETVFFAEAALPAMATPPAPGARGSVRIDCGWRPAGWILLRTPWATLRAALGW